MSKKAKKPRWREIADKRIADAKAWAKANTRPDGTYNGNEFLKRLFPNNFVPLSLMLGAGHRLTKEQRAEMDATSAIHEAMFKRKGGDE